MAAAPSRPTMAVSTKPISWLPTKPAISGSASRIIWRSSDDDRMDVRVYTGAMGKLIDYKVDAGVALLELTNPPANAYSYDMFRQLDDAILAARMDENVHVLVLRGAGDKFFCAGADIAMLDAVT